MSVSPPLGWRSPTDPSRARQSAFQGQQDPLQGVPRLDVPPTGSWWVPAANGVVAAAAPTSNVIRFCALHVNQPSVVQNYAVDITAAVAGSVTIEFGIWREDPQTFRPTGTPFGIVVISPSTGVAQVVTGTFGQPAAPLDVGRWWVGVKMGTVPGGATFQVVTPDDHPLPVDAFSTAALHGAAPARVLQWNGPYPGSLASMVSITSTSSWTYANNMALPYVLLASQ